MLNRIMDRAMLFLLALGCLALLAMVLPTAVGMAVCMLIHGAFGLLG